MNFTRAKVKVASTIVGVLGILWLISIAASYNTLAAHEVLLRIAVGFSFITLALQPEILFRPFSMAEARKQASSNKSPVTVVLAALSTVCFLLAGFAWLISH